MAFDRVCHVKVAWLSEPSKYKRAPKASQDPGIPQSELEVMDRGLILGDIVVSNSDPLGQVCTFLGHMICMECALTWLLCMSVNINLSAIQRGLRVHTALVSIMLD